MSESRQTGLRKVFSEILQSEPENILKIYHKIWDTVRND